MSGVSVVRYLLAQNAAVLAVVPATKIFAGVVPLGTALPAISVSEIDAVPRKTVAMTEPGTMKTERVQVTVQVKAINATPAGLGYPGQKALMRLVFTALPNQRGVVNTVRLDSLLPDGEGPDLFEDASGIHEQPQDFIVKYLS